MWILLQQRGAAAAALPPALLFRHASAHPLSYLPLPTHFRTGTAPPPLSRRALPPALPFRHASAHAHAHRYGPIFTFKTGPVRHVWVSAGSLADELLARPEAQAWRCEPLRAVASFCEPSRASPLRTFHAHPLGSLRLLLPHCTQTAHNTARKTARKTAQSRAQTARRDARRGGAGTHLEARARRRLSLWRRVPLLGTRREDGRADPRAPTRLAQRARGSRSDRQGA